MIKSDLIKYPVGDGISEIPKGTEYILKKTAIWNNNESAESHWRTNQRESNVDLKKTTPQLLL